MKTSTIAFSALNLLGMFCLVSYVSGARFQATMEGRDSSDFGDGLGFLLLVIPIVFLCLICNIAWAVMAAVDIYREQNYRTVAAFMSMVVFWAASVQVDRMLPDLSSSQPLSLQK